MVVIGFLLAIATATILALWLNDICERFVYWMGRKLGRIPECTPGNCYCPGSCEHING